MLAGFYLPASILILGSVLTSCGNPLRNAEGVNEAIRSAIRNKSASVELPPGEIHLDRPILISKNSAPFELRGSTDGTQLVIDAGFDSGAAIMADDVSKVTISGLVMIGNRQLMKSTWNLPLKEASFADYYTSNGIVIRHGTNVTVSDVSFSQIRAFPIIVNASSHTLIDRVVIEDCGTLNPQGHNNTTGGILIEEGSSGFEVRRARITRVGGNAIWTHSYARSPRQSDGSIHDNTISAVARDAIQVGHATRIRVEHNHGTQIGFPVEQIDFEGDGTPVALDTAGNVDQTVYANNDFASVNGQCMDLDGFHDGEVTGNSCTNPVVESATLGGAWLGLHFGIFFGNHDSAATSANVSVTNNTLKGFAYGGVFLVGSHNRIENNKFLDVNLLHCGERPTPSRCNALRDQPDALRSGIYLSDNGGRVTETRDNVIRNNTIEGFGMEEHCIAAKAGVDIRANDIGGNECTNPKLP